MKTVHRETWGYSIWIGKIQVGTGVGIKAEDFHVLILDTIQAKRIWRKHGIARLDS